MQMSGKSHGKAVRAKGINAVKISFGSLTYYAGAKIYKVGSVTNNYSRSRSAGIGAGVWGSGS